MQKSVKKVVKTGTMFLKLREKSHIIVQNKVAKIVKKKSADSKRPKKVKKKN